MVWIAPVSKRQKWATITAKVPHDLNDAIALFLQEAGLHNKSDAIRFLIAAGLDSQWSTQTHVISAIQANAKARALERFNVLMNRALETLIVSFNDPAFDIDAEDS
jgi:hypothetical protein